jgi:hypothetical protein
VSPDLVLEGSADNQIVQLHWKAPSIAKAYAVEWLNEDNQWQLIDIMEGEEATPHADDGFLEYVDQCPSPMGGGTYRVAAYRSSIVESDPFIRSNAVVLTPSKPDQRSVDELRRRLELLHVPASAKNLIGSLEWTPFGWRLVLPEEMGICLEKRLEVDVQSPRLTDPIIELLVTIFDHLPALSKRAEQAFNEYGHSVTDADRERLTRPRIVVAGPLHEEMPAGAWTIIINVKDSDYGWHIEFENASFKQIWAGD